MELIRNNLFRPGGLELYPNSAEMHYWRVERKHWPFCFRQIKEAGFSIVSTYVPWNHHEYERDKFDFSGETDPQRDLLSFLKECRQMGFRVILRPGPWICAEWKNGGHPDYLFESGALVARNAGDEPVHAGNCADVPKGFAPCYAHPEFLQHVRRYYTALIEAIREHLHPDGNVFLIQLDNEISHCFAGGVFDADYHEIVTANLYPRFLKDRYKEIERLNSIYLTDLKDFSECAPPRKLEITTDRDLARYFDWIEFKERYLATYIVQLRKMFTDLKVRTGFCTNIRWESDFVAPTNWPMFEKYSGLAGIDIYWPNDYHEVQRYIRYLQTTSILPWSAEFMAGLWSDDPDGTRKFRPITEKQQQFLVLSSLAAGLRGMNFYMFVERDHWYGSPVTADGRRAECWDFYKKLNEILNDNEYSETDKVNNVAVVHYQPYARYSYLDPEKPFDHIKDLCRVIMPDLCTDLGQLGVDYTIADPAQPESLEKHDILFIPIADYLDDRVAKSYEQLARSGKKLVFFGVHPRLDLLMRKSEIFCNAFGVRTAHHFVIEEMKWKDMQFKSRALGRLRLDEEWEPVIRDARGNVYAAHRKLGDGTVWFLGFEPSTNMVPAKRLFLETLLDELGAHRPARVEEPAIEAYIKVSEKHRFLFLINPDQSVREEFRPTLRRATLTLDVKLLKLHADSVSFVNMFTGEKFTEPLVEVREGTEFLIGNGEAHLYEVIPEYGR